MFKIKRKNSDSLEAFQMEWLEQKIGNSCLSITLLYSIVNKTDKSYFDLIVYYSNIINQASSFKIIFFEQNQQMKEVQNQLAIMRNNEYQEIQIINPQEFLQEWLAKKQAAPFLITFLISESQKNLIQSILQQAVEIVKFFNSIQESNLDDLYDKTIKFFKTLDRI